MLTLQVYTSPRRGRLLGDFTGRLHDGGGLSFSTGEHGFQGLSAPLIRMPLASAFEVYDWPGTCYVLVADNVGGTVWEGRLEDVAIKSGGIGLTALGYSRALSDLPYTALWSKASTADWDEVTEADRAAARPAGYEMDNNNRLYIAPRKGEVFGNNAAYGEMTYALPDAGVRDILKFTADYAMTMPSGWELRILTCDEAFGSVVVEATITATGSAQTGSLDLSTTAAQRVVFSLRNNSGGNSTITAETGAQFARLTDVRVQSTTAATVTASAIASALAGYVNGINGSQLSAVTALIEATTNDLHDEVYEDAFPADILGHLAAVEGWEWGVYERQMLYFRPRGWAARHWYVDVAGDLTLQRTLDSLRNSAYGVYRSARGGALRTNTVGDADSQARYGLIRRGFVNVQTTSLGEAQVHRSAFLNDHSTIRPRAQVDFERLYDAAGAVWPLWSARAGDTITVRNLPPTLSADIDRVRTFRLAETEYDAAAGVLSVTPEAALPTLDRLLARREAGLS